jgi:hypothetical protein
VEGQVVIPPSLAGRHDWGWGFMTQAMTAPKPIQRVWFGGLFSAPKPGSTTQPAVADIPHSYPLQIGEDGKFRLEDVLPGTYTMNLSIVAISGNNNVGFNMNDVLASGRGEFTVAEMPGGRSDDVLTVPPITLTMVPRVNVGDVAPDFGARTPDGKDIKLSDYKGKFILLNFFSDGLPADAAEIPALKTANAAFTGDDRFFMIAVDIGGSASELTKYAQASGINWQTATLTVSRGNSPMESFAIRQLPSIWLIGPDGKVVAKDLHGDAIKAALTTALGPQGL